MRLPGWTASRGIWAAGGLLVIWAFAPLVALIVQVLLHGGVLTGSDGAAASADQFQYLAWIRDSGTRGLIWNSFELARTHSVFLHPMFLLSGVAWRLGLGIQLAYLLWKPVAIVTLLGGFAAYASRFEVDRRLAATMFLALFCLSPVLPVLVWLGQLHGTRFNWVLGIEELSPAWQLWGYPATAIAIGLMPVALLCGERALATPQPKRQLIVAGLIGALVAWLHPWQGATLVLIWIGLFALGRGARVYRRLALPVAATILPLIYYEVLDHVDAAWKLGQVQNQYPHLSAWSLLGATAPLGLLALPALRAPGTNTCERITRLWIVAGLVVYFATSTFPEHALQGLSLPLAVLAVAGWRRLALGPHWAALAVTVAVIPGAIWSASFYLDNVRSHVAPYILTSQEHAALTFLDRSRGTGGVLASEYLGMTVPAFTGRDTWRGHDVWTPAFATRDRLATELFSGRMPVSGARSLVRDSGARFLLAGCDQRADLAPELGSIITSVRRFGCVTVYGVS